jgi:hypothetical protein
VLVKGRITQTASVAQALGEPTNVRQRLQSLNLATREVLAEYEPASDAEVELTTGNAARAG